MLISVEQTRGTQSPSEGTFHLAPGEVSGTAARGHPAAASISLPAAWSASWALQPVADTRPCGLSRVRSTPGRAGLGPVASKGKQSELGAPHSALRAAAGFGRDEYFPLDAWL